MEKGSFTQEFVAGNVGGLLGISVVVSDLSLTANVLFLVIGIPVYDLIVPFGHSQDEDADVQ
jgi:hypothetical protein